MFPAVDFWNWGRTLINDFHKVLIFSAKAGWSFGKSTRIKTCAAQPFPYSALTSLTGVLVVHKREEILWKTARNIGPQNTQLHKNNNNYFQPLKAFLPTQKKNCSDTAYENLKILSKDKSISIIVLIGRNKDLFWPKMLQNQMNIFWKHTKNMSLGVAWKVEMCHFNNLGIIFFQELRGARKLPPSNI